VWASGLGSDFEWNSDAAEFIFGVWVMVTAKWCKIGYWLGESELSHMCYQRCSNVEWTNMMWGAEEELIAEGQVRVR
jgi:hypothetical protein